MVFAEIESQLRTEGGWNMHIAIALIMALLVTAGVLWFFFAPRKAYRALLRDGWVSRGLRRGRKTYPMDNRFRFLYHI